MLDETPELRIGQERRRCDRRSGGDRRRDGVAPVGPWERREREYAVALSMIQNQRQLIWIVLGAFFIPDTVILGLILRLLPDPLSGGGRSEIAVFVPALIGLLLTVALSAAFARTTAYYRLRVAQALEIEKSLGFTFLSDGSRFRGGEQVHGESMSRVVRGLPLWGIAWLPILALLLVFLAAVIATNPLIPLV